MIVENDSIRPIERLILKIKEKGFIHHCLLEYLGISSGRIDKLTKKEEKLEELFLILKEKSILTNKCEFKDFLKTLSHLYEMNLRKKEIKNKIEDLIMFLKKDIKNTFSNEEIFHFLKKNSIFSWFLLEQNILSIRKIIKFINIYNINNWYVIKYFYPGFERYLNELILKKDFSGIKKIVEENDQNPELFIRVRKEGEKEPKIIELIKEDKIEEFISLVEHSSINLNEKILMKETIFGEIIKNLTPLELSALFGSLTIFKYLYLKEVDINFNIEHDNNNIIEYAIRGRNYEIIHILEEEEIKKDLNNQEHQHKYLEVSINMHYNEIFEYFMTSYNIQVTKEIIKLIFISQNYQIFDQLFKRRQIEFTDKAIITNIFHYICLNGDEEMVKILINLPNLDTSKDVIFHHSFKMIQIHKIHK